MSKESGGSDYYKSSVWQDSIKENFTKRHQTRETADLFMALIVHLLKPGG